jgi:hypothetical protein
MRKGIILLVLAWALVAVPAALALLPEHAVLTGARNDRNPAADWNGTESVLAWSRSRPANRNRYDAWVKHGAAAPIKLNTVGQGWIAGMDYPFVVYQRVLDGASNLLLYDLSTDTRPDMPAGVNTERWEWHATLSGDWLLFGRDNNQTLLQRVVLHDMVMGTERLLVTNQRRRHFIAPGQVNGNWATYTRCTPVCNVVVYDIGADTRTTLPKPPAATTPHQHASAVTDDGTVYLVRVGRRCGRNVRLVRYGPTDPPTGVVIAQLPNGRNITYSFARENPLDGSVDLFYDRETCSNERWDVYKVTDPPPGP